MQQNAENIEISRSIKTIAVMMVLVLTAKISGLLRDVLIVRLLGTSPEGVAWSLASQIPRNFLDVAFAAAISASFIPVFNNYLEKKTKHEAFTLANNFVSFVMIFALAASFIGLLAAAPIAAAHLLNSAGLENAALMEQLLRILIFTIFTTTTAFALVGVLQSLGGFYVPSIMSLVPNVLVLVFMLLFVEQLGVLGLAVTFMIGNVLQLAILFPPLKKRGFNFKFAINLKNPGFLQVLRLTPLVLVSAWLFPINNIVNNYLVANYSAKATVELSAANTLYLVITGFFVLSVTNVLFPRLSKEAAKDKSQFSSILSGAISAVSFVLIPMSVGLWVLRVPIVNLIYLSDEFTAASVQNAADALGFASLGMVGFGLFTILSRAFFAVMDGKIPMIISVAAILVNLLISAITINLLGVQAAAMAATVSITFAGVVMMVVICRRYAILSGGMAVNFAKMLASSVLMGGVLLLMMTFMPNTPDIILIGTISLAGIIIYATINLLLRTNEAKLAKSLILTRFRKVDN